MSAPDALPDPAGEAASHAAGSHGAASHAAGSQAGASHAGAGVVERDAGVPAQGGAVERRPGVVREILGKDEDPAVPLPELPPLPADPRWRIEHLPFVTVAGVAVVLCAASAGFFLGGPTAALGAAAGVLVVVMGFTITTLAIAWADAIRPALVMPVGMLTYVIKYVSIAFVLMSVAGSGWAGGRPMAWGIAGGAVALTGIQVWWVSRLARRNLPGAPAAKP
jgi:hypothetical protein